MKSIAQHLFRWHFLGDDGSQKIKYPDSLSADSSPPQVDHAQISSHKYHYSRSGHHLQEDVLVASVTAFQMRCFSPEANMKCAVFSYKF